MIRDEDLREMLDQAASSISERDGNPASWHTWLVYLLQQMETQSQGPNPRNSELYREMLSRLQESIRTRFNTGGW
jgi:hypothetical protein